MKKISLVWLALLSAVVLAVLHYVGHYWLAPMFPSISSVMIVEVVVFVTTFAVVYTALRVKA